MKNIKKIFEKKKTYTFKDFLELTKPSYKILQIIPDTSIRNYSSEEIAKTICTLYRIPIQRITRQGFKIYYNLPEKVSFMIDISLYQCSFYLICPSLNLNLFKEKCMTVWDKATINEIDSIPNFSNQALKYQLNYEKKDALSLKVDKKCNEPLNSILNVIDIMDETDRIGVMYNFLPCSQRMWRSEHLEAINNMKKGLPMDKQVLNFLNIAKWTTIGISYVLKEVLDIFLDYLSNKPIATEKSFFEEMAISNLAQEQWKKLSKNSREKGDEKIINTQIMILSDSADNKRKISNAQAVCESYKILGENNNLVYKKMKDGHEEWIGTFKIAGTQTNKMSTKEVQNFLEIPGYSLLNQHKNISKVDTLENPIPEQLQHGTKFIGTTSCKGKKYNAYLRDEYNIGNLPLVVLAPQNAGKSTLISNITKDSSNAGECNIIIDFIKNNELSHDVLKAVDKNKNVIIDCSIEDFDRLEGFGYNEIKCIKENDFNKLETANLQAKQISALIDSINIEDKPLTGQMRRYLSAAANTCCLLGHINIGETIECLQSHEIRMTYLNELNEKFDVHSNKIIEKKINTLLELNEIDKNGIITGTKSSNIKGILDRVSLLEEDTRMEIMFNKNCDNNTNLLECMEQGKNVFILMPEHIFQDKISKNIMVTYWVSKIILAIKLRGSLKKQPLRTNIYIDEVYQVPIAESLIKETLAQTRKFGGHWVFSCHYLDQIDILRDELKGSGASYMLLKGADLKNYEELEEDLKPFEYEDLRNMKQYQSMNLIQYEDGFARFITQLPPPIK